MKIVLMWILSGAALLVVVLVVAGQLGLLQGKRPGHLGVKDGRLKPPSRTPNSVSSQAHWHADHPQLEYARIDALPLHAGGAKASIAGLRKLIEPMRGASVIEHRDDYLLVEFQTPLLRFTDDVELWADPAAGVIQVRSSSRLGRLDFGVNRARVERIRAAWGPG